MMAVAGTLYSFNAYSEGKSSLVLLMRLALKEKGHYTDVQVNLVIGIANIGLSVGGPPGTFYHKCGPRWTSLLGGILTASGYVVLWASFTNRITQNTGFVSFIYVLIAQGNLLTYMAALLTQVENFPVKHRGKVVGIIDSMFGAR